MIQDVHLYQWEMSDVSTHRSHSPGVGLSLLTLEKIILDPKLADIENEGNDHHHNDQLYIRVGVCPI